MEQSGTGGTPCSKCSTCSSWSRILKIHLIYCYSINNLYLYYKIWLYYNSTIGKHVPVYIYTLLLINCCLSCIYESCINYLVKFWYEWNKWNTLFHVFHLFHIIFSVIGIRYHRYHFHKAFDTMIPEVFFSFKALFFLKKLNGTLGTNDIFNSGSLIKCHYCRNCRFCHVPIY